MNQIDCIREEIINDHENTTFTNKGWTPVFNAFPESKILIVSQPPTQKEQRSGKVYHNLTGSRLRNWLGVDEATFFDSHLISIMPIDFYYQGNEYTGVLPPRPIFAPKWHTQLLEHMPNIELTILIGKYSQRHYLQDRMKNTITEAVYAYEEYLPEFMPIMNPSPLNNKWFSNNPRYRREVIPRLQERVAEVLDL